jgi:hypothetical protein
MTSMISDTCSQARSGWSATAPRCQRHIALIQRPGAGLMTYARSPPRFRSATSPLCQDEGKRSRSTAWLRKSSRERPVLGHDRSPTQMRPR